MGTNRRSQIPAPALVISGTATSSFDPKAIPSRRARWPCRPGWGNHRRCPSFPVICVLLSPSGAAGVFICAEGEEQKSMQKGRGREVGMMHMGGELRQDTKYMFVYIGMHENVKMNPIILHN